MRNLVICVALPVLRQYNQRRGAGGGGGASGKHRREEKFIQEFGHKFV
jgi:hypothetical protein